MENLLKVHNNYILVMLIEVFSMTKNSTPII